MPSIVTFVVAIGRMSMGDAVARPVIEQVVGKLGGVVRPGGDGSSAAPIIADFADKMVAVEAAKELWYHDSIESATVHDADNLATSSIKEGVSEGTIDPLDAVASGLSVEEAVDAMLVAKLTGKTPTVQEGAEQVDETCCDDEADLPCIKALAEDLRGLVTKHGASKNMTVSTFVQDAAAAADSLDKIVASHAPA